MNEQRLKIPASLHKCLATMNLIKSPHSGIRKRTRNVCRWRDVDMVERWAASAWLLTEKNFRRIDGHKANLQLNRGDAFRERLTR